MRAEIKYILRNRLPVSQSSPEKESDRGWYAATTEITTETRSIQQYTRSSSSFPPPFGLGSSRLASERCTAWCSVVSTGYVRRCSTTNSERSTLPPPQKNECRQNLQTRQRCAATAEKPRERRNAVGAERRDTATTCANSGTGKRGIETTVLEEGRRKRRGKKRGGAGRRA